jgi:hypothetical protein
MGMFVNGSWTGMMRMVIDRKVDFCLNTLALDAQRYQAVDFSFPYDFDYFTIVSATPNEQSKALTIFKPFSLSVWLMLLASVVVGTVMFHILKGFSRNRFLFTDAWASVLGQTLTGLGTRFSFFVFFAAWSFAMILMGKIYSSDLFSRLISPTFERPIDTIQQLEDSGYAWYVKLGTNQGSIAEDRPKLKSKLGMVPLAEFFDKIHSIPRKRNLAAITSPRPLRSALLEIETGIEFDRYHMSKENVDIFMPAPTLVKRSPLTSHFDRTIITLRQVGILDYLTRLTIYQNSLWPMTKEGKRAEHRRQRHVQRQDAREKLKLVHFTGAFFALLIGYGLGVVAFAFEVFCDRRGRQRVVDLRKASRHRRDLKRRA